MFGFTEHGCVTRAKHTSLVECYPFGPYFYIPLGNIRFQIADYFIICSGTSEIQMRAVAEAVEDVFDKEKLPCRREGTGKWLLVDGGDVIIHIFHEDTRRFYELEKLWADAKVMGD